ncbi:hypothetical protein E2562_022410 [Oryza meyeriana var. granulata]|uniref:AAA+ ATPase domain-containing protein n=1 Tax=Oryza meyeriana var. granulata TaxID=110450 RepID=A0A6G1BMQ9_9ORYZ|nr:hypothetical protein E2562_022410 [Oryza meyeriana var. granulata]
MVPSVENWAAFGSAIGCFALLWSSLPEHALRDARDLITSWSPVLASYFNPYEKITISEYSDDEKFRKNKLFDVVATYLRSKCMEGTGKLKAELSNEDEDTHLSLDEHQEVVDNSFHGYRMRWYLGKTSKYSNANIVIGNDEDTETRHYRLVFHKRHRPFVLNSYLPDIIQQGRELIAKNRRRRLFTNAERGNYFWIHIPWKHPATFDTLAMDPGKKNELIEDLEMFQKGKDYHSRVGKAWKRGYLLYGPPGTGKSSLISAMAHFLGYDVYDLDLTSVTSNHGLRKLFLDTAEKSIIVIEDIHAIEDELTTRSKRKKETNGDELQQLRLRYEKEKVTLSGLLNLIDGLWSSFGGERIFVLTTNHFDRLDPALIRQGRMDMHIEMSYCRFDAFKVFAKNYLNIDGHPLFVEIQQLLDGTNMTPAEVAHNLMPRGKRKRNDVDECLERLVETLKKPNLETGAPRKSPIERPTRQKRARWGNMC